MKASRLKIGFVGLGIMGKAMARNLLRAGFQLSVWNRTKSKVADLVAAGAEAAADLPELARACDVVVIMVNDTPDVEAVLFAENGLHVGLQAGRIVIDMSTISPEATEELARKLGALGCQMLDAPVSGGDVGAKNGTLTIMVGGERAVFEHCLPIFEALGKKIVYCGSHGHGQRTKLINQVLCGLHTVALCEAFALAEKMGLDLPTVHEVVASGAAGSWALDNYGPRLLRGDLQPGFKLSLQQKDLRIASEVAVRYGGDFRGTQLAFELFSEAKERGWGDLGSHGLFRLYESSADKA